MLVVLAVWLSFLLVSFVSSPLPGVNEAHYFTKSKHFWNPEWCSRDFFLTSFPAHQVFYQTFGWLTLWFDLPTVAIMGRVLGTALLAVSWTALTSRLLQQSTADNEPTRPSPASLDNVLLSAWLFLGLQAVGNLSGEWLIGGFESKVVAYAFVFGSIAARLNRRFKTAAACAGVAISFHPIVGLWHVAAACIAEIANRKSQIKNDTSPLRVRRPYAELGLLTVTALPGLWPAWQMLQAVDSRMSFAANFVQVFYRLKHHLDPMDFGLRNYLGYVVLAVVWLGLLVNLRRREQLTPSDRWWIAYLAATALFALAGFLAGVGPRPAQQMWGYDWRMRLMKFYPFRLFDLMLPIAVSAIVPRVIGAPRRRLLWAVAFVGFGGAIVEGRLFEPPFPWTREARADWQDACHWIAANTPSDALFLTPIESDSFKWYAQRAEFVNRKDCPQDAAGIVEWNRRLTLMDHWGKAGFADQRYSADELRALRRQTGAEFALTRRRVPYEADLIYSNDTFNVFRLPDVSRP